MSNEVTNPASCQTAIMGSTHLIVLKDWKTPYNSIKKKATTHQLIIGLKN